MSNTKSAPDWWPIVVILAVALLLWGANDSGYRRGACDAAWDLAPESELAQACDDEAANAEPVQMGR